MQRGRVFEQPRAPEPCFDEAPGPRHNVCAFPSRAELRPLGELLRARRLLCVSVGCGAGFFERLLEREHGVRVVGVDVDVHAALDGERTAAAYRSGPPTFLSSVVRVRGAACSVLCPAAAWHHAAAAAAAAAAGGAGGTAAAAAIAAAASAATTASTAAATSGGVRGSMALLFVFGRRCPLDAYLAAYGERVGVVAIVGDADAEAGRCNTDPPPHALRGAVRWRIIYSGAVRSVPPAATMVVYERVADAATSAGSKLVAGEDRMDDAEIDAI